MIGLYLDDGSRIKHVYNGLDLNSPTDARDDTYELNTVVFKTVIDAPSDPRPQGDGFEVLDPQKLAKVIRVDGVIRAPTLAKLFDKIESIAKTFDPILVSRDNAASNGFIQYKFDVPTTDTATYPTGKIPCFYYARAKVAIEPPISMYTGTAVPFTIEMFCKDPRRYHQTAGSLTGAGTAANTKADYPSMPTLTITMSGAGSATYTATNSTVSKSIVLNLSGTVNNDVIVVDMDKKKITKNGTETPSLFVSGDFWQMKEGNNTISYSNTTNVSSSVLAWYPAFSL